MFGLQQGQMGMSAPGFGGGYGASPYGGGGFGGFGGGSMGGSMGGVMGGSDPSSIDSQMMALGQQNQMQGAMYLQMFNLMGMVMQMTMMKQMMSSMANFGGGSGGGGGDAGINSFLGGDSSGGGAAAGGASAASGASDATGGASGSSAVDIAKKYMGRKSGEINDMANFTHAGGMTNNCADFVSACLANAGVYKKKPGDASVRVLKGHLIEDGWKKVGKAQAKPGDVAIFNGTQHIELVATQGATQLIGSNNKGNASTQTVSTDSGNWGSVEYYTK